MISLHLNIEYKNIRSTFAREDGRINISESLLLLTRMKVTGVGYANFLLHHRQVDYWPSDFEIAFEIEIKY